MVDFEFEFNNIQLYFLLLLVGFYIYSLIKLGSIFWLVPEHRMPKAPRKSLRLRYLAHPLPGRRTGFLMPARRLTALPVERTKAWHSTISNESRHRIVRKLITSTFNSTRIFKSHRKPKYYGSMVSFVRMLEASLFKTANSKPEYYQLISEKMHLFRKELKQRRLMRRKQLHHQLLYLHRLPERPQMVLDPECLHSQQRFSTDLNNGHTVVNMPAADERKDWHEWLPCRSRMHMVNELMMNMLPDFPLPLEWNTKQIAAHARDVANQIEGDVFRTANSKEEYYQMMGEKMVIAKNKYRSEAEEQMKKEAVVVVVPPEKPAEEDARIEEAGVPHNTSSSYVMDVVAAQSDIQWMPN